MPDNENTNCLLVKINDRNILLSSKLYENVSEIYQRIPVEILEVKIETSKEKQVIDNLKNFVEALNSTDFTTKVSFEVIRVISTKKGVEISSDAKAVVENKKKQDEDDDLIPIPDPTKRKRRDLSKIEDEVRSYISKELDEGREVDVASLREKFKEYKLYNLFFSRNLKSVKDKRLDKYYSNLLINH